MKSDIETSLITQTRAIKLTDTEWGRFDEIGGVDWLRMALHTMKPTAYARLLRDKAIRADIQEGMSPAAAARKHGVHRITVWRML